MRSGTGFHSLSIAYAYDAPLPHTGADAEQVVNTAAALARRGVSIELLIPGLPQSTADPAVLREYFQVAGDFRLGLVAPAPIRIRLFEKWVHAFRVARDPRLAAADLAYTRNLPSAITLLRAGHRVVYEHFRPWGDQYPVLRPVLRWLLRHPRLVGAIFHSAHTRDSYLRLGAPPERLLVAHNGWDPLRMEPRLSRELARTRVGLPAEATVAVYTGRINRKKGLDILLEVARRLPQVTFVLVGSEGEGPIEAEARRLANVRVVGWQRFADLAPYLYAADLLLIPPSLEPLQRHGNTVLPIKLFLYLASGRAILAPQAPDTAELLTDHGNALLVPPGDIDATTVAIQSLTRDPALASRLGKAALATAQGLSWDSRSHRILSFLNSRLGN
jgi:glycosyltransferase involved in cell wall biosynthesis